MTAPIARILLRYLAGALFLAAGVDDSFGQQFINDPDVLNLTQLALSAAITGVTEGWYWAARKFGWAK